VGFHCLSHRQLFLLAITSAQALLDESADATDLREAQAAGGALAASRKDAWLAHCLSKSMEFQAQVFKLHQARPLWA
jgi:hypothetical protein